jgi:hypothetical protein
MQASTAETYMEPDSPSFHPPLLMCCKKRDVLVDAQLRVPPHTGIWFEFPWRPTSNMTLTTKASLSQNYNKPWRLFLSYQNAVFNLLSRPFPPIRSLLWMLLLLTIVYHVVRVAHFAWATMRVFSPMCVVWEYIRFFLVFSLANIQFKVG